MQKEELYDKLISLNKEQEQRSPELKVIKPKIRAGFRFRIKEFGSVISETNTTLREALGQQAVGEDKDFLKDLKNMVDGAEYLDEIKPYLKDLPQNEIIHAMSDLYLKPGHVFDRKVVLVKNLPHELDLENLSTIYIFFNKNAYSVQSSTPFMYKDNSYQGAAYNIERKNPTIKKEELIKILKEENNVK